MTVLLLLPAGLSALLVAAHLLRSGGVWPAALALAAPAALALRRRWVARGFQLALLLAAAEWCRTLVALRAARMAAQEPWGRMTGILAGVAALAVGAALLFQTPRLARLYRLDRRGGPPPSPAPETMRDRNLSSSRQRGTTETERSRK